MFGLHSEVSLWTKCGFLTSSPTLVSSGLPQGWTTCDDLEESIYSLMFPLGGHDECLESLCSMASQLLKVTEHWPLTHGAADQESQIFVSDDLFGVHFCPSLANKQDVHILRTQTKNPKSNSLL